MLTFESLFQITPLDYLDSTFKSFAFIHPPNEIVDKILKRILDLRTFKKGNRGKTVTLDIAVASVLPVDLISYFKFLNHSDPPKAILEELSTLNKKLSGVIDDLNKKIVKEKLNGPKYLYKDSLLFDHKALLKCALEKGIFPSHQHLFSMKKNIDYVMKGLMESYRNISKMTGLFIFSDNRMDTFSRNWPHTDFIFNPVFLMGNISACNIAHLIPYKVTASDCILVMPSIDEILNTKSWISCHNHTPMSYKTFIKSKLPPPDKIVSEFFKNLDSGLDRCESYPHVIIAPIVPCCLLSKIRAAVAEHNAKGPHQIEFSKREFEQANDSLSEFLTLLNNKIKDECFLRHMRYFDGTLPLPSVEALTDKSEELVMRKYFKTTLSDVMKAWPNLVWRDSSFRTKERILSESFSDISFNVNSDIELSGFFKALGSKPKDPDNCQLLYRIYIPKCTKNSNEDLDRRSRLSESLLQRLGSNVKLQKEDTTSRALR